MIQLPNYLQIDGRVAMGSSDVREKEIGDGNLVPVEISTIRSDSQLVMTENLAIINIVNVVNGSNDIGSIDHLSQHISGPYIKTARYIGWKSILGE